MSLIFLGIIASLPLVRCDQDRFKPPTSGGCSKWNLYAKGLSNINFIENGLYCQYHGDYYKCADAASGVTITSCSSLRGNGSGIPERKLDLAQLANDARNCRHWTLKAKKGWIPYKGPGLYCLTNGRTPMWQCDSFDDGTVNIIQNCPANMNSSRALSAEKNEMENSGMIPWRQLGRALFSFCPGIMCNQLNENVDEMENLDDIEKKLDEIEKKLDEEEKRIDAEERHCGHWTKVSMPLQPGPCIGRGCNLGPGLYCSKDGLWRCDTATRGNFDFMGDCPANMNRPSNPKNPYNTNERGDGPSVPCQQWKLQVSNSFYSGLYCQEGNDVYECSVNPLEGHNMNVVPCPKNMNIVTLLI